MQMMLHQSEVHKNSGRRQAGRLPACLLVFCLGLCLLAAPLLGAKEPAPFLGGFQPEIIMAPPGKTAQLTLHVETRETFQEVEVAVTVPAGLKLVDGAARAVLDNFRPGEKKRFTYTFKVLGDGEQRVLAAVTVLGLGPNQVLSRAFSACVNKSPAAAEQSEIKTDAQGNKIRVIKIR